MKVPALCSRYCNEKALKSFQALRELYSSRMHCTCAQTNETDYEAVAPSVLNCSTTKRITKIQRLTAVPGAQFRMHQSSNRQHQFAWRYTVINSSLWFSYANCARKTYKYFGLFHIYICKICYYRECRNIKTVPNSSFNKINVFTISCLLMRINPTSFKLRLTQVKLKKKQVNAPRRSKFANYDYI